MATYHFQDTLNEDIADNGGLRKAYRAFKTAWSRVGGMNAKLPGLRRFTPEQMFFLGYATVGIVARLILLGACLFSP
jgi:predicted metalloendopeptidase